MNCKAEAVCEKAFLDHVCLLPESQQDRYFDIIETLRFSMEISSSQKIDFEFQNLCDFLDDTCYDKMDVVFEIWGDAKQGL